MQEAGHTEGNESATQNANLDRHYKKDNRQNAESTQVSCWPLIVKKAWLHPEWENGSTTMPPVLLLVALDEEER